MELQLRHTQESYFCPTPCVVFGAGVCCADAEDVREKINRKCGVVCRVCWCSECACVACAFMNENLPSVPESHSSERGRPFASAVLHE